MESLFWISIIPNILCKLNAVAIWPEILKFLTKQKKTEQKLSSQCEYCFFLHIMEEMMKSFLPVLYINIYFLFHSTKVVKMCACAARSTHARTIWKTFPDPPPNLNARGDRFYADLRNVWNSLCGQLIAHVRINKTVFPESLIHQP